MVMLYTVNTQHGAPVSGGAFCLPPPPPEPFQLLQFVSPLGLLFREDLGFLP